MDYINAVLWKRIAVLGEKKMHRVCMYFIKCIKFMHEIYEVLKACVCYSLSCVWLFATL